MVTMVLWRVHITNRHGRKKGITRTANHKGEGYEEHLSNGMSLFFTDVSLCSGILVFVHN